MTTCRVLGALVLAAAVGCQSGTAAYQSVRLPSGDYERTFDIARQVIGEQFSIAQADKATGKIVTSPQAVPEGTQVMGEVLNLPGEVRGMRRIVTARVTSQDKTTLVSVKVQLEAAQTVQRVPRPTYSEYDPTVTGSDADVYRSPETRAGVAWQSAGSDVEMERKLLDEIERRMQGASVEGEVESKPVEE